MRVIWKDISLRLMIYTTIIDSIMIILILILNIFIIVLLFSILNSGYRHHVKEAENIVLLEDKIDNLIELVKNK